MKLILALAMLYGTAVYAEDWKISKEVRDACEKAGGCVLMIPSGKLITADMLNEMVFELQKQAYETGLSEGAQSCKRKDV